MTDLQEQNQELLDSMLECSSCTDIGSFKMRRPKSGKQLIDYFMNVLPGISYVKEMFGNYIFSNGMKTGFVDQDEKLDEFLYRKNDQQNTNYSVLKNVIEYAAIYGECGLRWMDGNIYMLESGEYGVLSVRRNGVTRVLGYVCSENGDSVEDIEKGVKETLEAQRDGFDGQSFLREWEERGLIYLSTDDFVNVRNDTSLMHGQSPLLKDKLRLKLITTVYERLNYDVEYDGPGRIIIRPKTGYVAGEDNEVSTREVMSQGMRDATKRLEKAKKEAENVAKQIKDSSSDSVILLSDAFNDDITKLPRVTKATEFFSWLSNEGVILAQDIGMSPALLELGDISGNVSMEKIIDNAMLNSIVPTREKYAIQISPLLSSKLGISKVYFDKYELQQAEDENSMRTKIVNIMAQLHAMEQYDLENDFAEMLRKDIRTDKNTLRELKVGKKEKNDEQSKNNDGNPRKSGRNRAIGYEE